MTLEFPEVRVAEPIPCGGLIVFPLFAAGDSTIDYLLAHEGMESGIVAVREVSEAGSIHELLIDNGGKSPVSFPEGLEFRGAGRQNRLVGESVLLAAGSHTHIGVVCAERGRWTDAIREHFVAGAFCPPTLRHLLKQTARESVATIDGHRPSQLAIWNEILRRHAAVDVLSQTEDLSAVLGVRHDEVEQLRERLPYPESACGIAVTLPDRVICADIMDKAATLAQIWDRMVLGLAMDVLETGSSEREPTTQFVRAHLGFVQHQMEFERVPNVGLGRLYHAQRAGILASALVVDGVPVHFSTAFQWNAPTD